MYGKGLGLPSFVIEGQGQGLFLHGLWKHGSM